MAELNSLPVDLYTALPLLQLLLAIRGLEEPDMPFRQTWSVFKEFAGAGDSSSDPIVTVSGRSGLRPDGLHVSAGGRDRRVRSCLGGVNAARRLPEALTIPVRVGRLAAREPLLPGSMLLPQVKPKVVRS